MICEDCISKINGFHSFATMALKSQEKIKRCILSAPASPEATKANSVSLLHTYLTKGTDEKVTQNNETEVMEMEVRVDPMSILQCCLDETESEDESEANAANSEKDEDDNEESTDDEAQSNSLENGSETENSENTCIIYLCSICKRSFTTNLALQDHMYVHSAKRTLSLIFNKFQENLTTVYVNSSETTHNGETQEDESILNKCPICAKHISSKGALKVHLETHRPKGQYGCDICGRVFKTQCNLYRHKEYHQGVQFPCEVCGRVYPTNSTLRAHSITHSDLRPHKCPLCDKTFKRNQDLKFHINQHTGARPYQCPYCPKAFASSGNCFSHRKRMHSIEVERDRERAAKIMR